MTGNVVKVGTAAGNAIGGSFWRSVMAASGRLLATVRLPSMFAGMGTPMKNSEMNLGWCSPELSIKLTWAIIMKD